MGRGAAKRAPKAPTPARSRTPPSSRGQTPMGGAAPIDPGLPATGPGSSSGVAQNANQPANPLNAGATGGGQIRKKKV